MMLEVEDGCEVVGEVGTGAAIVSLVDGLGPDLMLVPAHTRARRGGRDPSDHARPPRPWILSHHQW